MERIGDPLWQRARETCQEAVNAGRLNGHRLNRLTCNHAPGSRDLIPATPEQISAIADAMGPDGLAVRIMRSTGLRVAECLALRKAGFITSVDGGTVVHVSRQRQNGQITPLKHRRDFTGRDVPVPASMAAMVAERPDGDLFTCTASSFRHRFNRAARNAGLPAEFSPHQLRHGFTSPVARRRGHHGRDALDGR